ncbi:PLP-dependent aminotransferase family protein [Corynebacterium mayonis]|uniref:MocR-like pyridoxine biosynthesis transcription factor PdxR n=1 Tax=Corynebacterium mayonis TaxID=3062461 RepID=UPI003140A26A
MFEIDRRLPTPLPAQIANELRRQVALGSLVAGDRVPSTRELSRALGVSRGSVVAAYDQLLSEGFLKSSQGAPTVVHPDLPTPAEVRPRRLQPSHHTKRTHDISLRPSSGHAETIRPAAWRRAWREAADVGPEAVDKAGQPALRWAIAEHLRLSRGMQVDPDQVIVTGGSREGLLLILMSLGRGLRVGVENPGHPGLRRVIALSGHACVECATDAQGMVPKDLPADLDAVLVTPAHLFPLGKAMPAARRSALSTWARDTNTVIIEDDYNAELRYRYSPHPPLAVSANQSPVLTLGTFSTLLSTQLSAGYVLADPDYAAALHSARAVLGMPVSPVTQYAIASLLDAGQARRNSRTVHKRLLQRRKVIADTLMPAFQAAGATVDDGGETISTDLAVRFAAPEKLSAFRRQLDCAGLGYGTFDESRALHLSFAHLGDGDFAAAVELLVAKLRTSR